MTDVLMWNRLSRAIGLMRGMAGDARVDGAEACQDCAWLADIGLPRFATNDASWESGAMNLELVNFDQPSETRTFEKGRFDLYRVGPAALGRA